MEPFVHQITSVLSDVASQLPFNSTQFSTHLVEPLTHFALHGPAFPILTIAHALYTANSVYSVLHDQFWLVNLLLSLFTMLGGATLANLITSEPHPAFRTNHQIPTMLICWWFLHFFPHDLGRRVYMLMPIRTVGAALHILNRCRSITAALYRGTHVFPGSVVGAIGVAMLQGIGGWIASLLVKKSFNPNDESIQNPGWSIHGLVYGTIFLYVALDPEDILFGGQKIMSPTAAILSFTAVNVLHVTIEVLFSVRFTPFPFNIITNTFFRATNIPGTKRRAADHQKIKKQ